LLDADRIPLYYHQHTSVNIKQRTARMTLVVVVEAAATVPMERERPASSLSIDLLYQKEQDGIIVTELKLCLSIVTGAIRFSQRKTPCISNGSDLIFLLIHNQIAAPPPKKVCIKIRSAGYY
jgi:hypothetical protein